MRPGAIAGELQHSGRRGVAGGLGTALAVAAFIGVCNAAGAVAPLPPAWEVMPIPRWVDYGAPDAFCPVGKVAVVRKENGPYHTRRTDTGRLAPDSTITEQEVLGALAEAGVKEVASLPDDHGNWDSFDTLILLGRPDANQVSAAVWSDWGLSFDRWDDPNTPEDDFTNWPSLGAEGYVLKVAPWKGKTVILLAGYDRDDAAGRFHGAGTFYAFQSFRQLLSGAPGAVRVKCAEMADKPLVSIRGCFTGFDPSEELQWRVVDFLPRMKANQNVWWYGNNIAEYNAKSASKFRYPWSPEQLACFERIGRYCEERFVTMVFCMNADHFTVVWATPKSFDGTRIDPLHYNPDHPVEPEIKQLWAALGYDVKNDIDVFAAKFAQIGKVLPSAMFQVMNEDDAFGLYHKDDIELFQTGTPDELQNAVNYGKARGKLLGALYRRIEELCPADRPRYMSICPPSQVAYQTVLERNEGHFREFMTALGTTLREEGLGDLAPLITTGGGTAAEVLTNEKLDAFHTWAAGAPVLICDNNFPGGFHLGAYETDPKGPRSPHQFSETFPAGYREKTLYQHMWGVQWNGIDDQHVLAWSQAQYMWNMLALDREKTNALAVRKVSDDASYATVKELVEEYDNPACYLPDIQPPNRLLTVSDRIIFPSKEWVYEVSYTGAYRQEAQRLRGLLGRLLPELERSWADTYHRVATLNAFGYSRYSFASIFLANGYVRGWTDDNGADTLQGEALRNLLLEAEDFQQRFLAGPDKVDDRLIVDRSYYSSPLQYLYSDGSFNRPFPTKPEEATHFTDFWGEGLRDRFYTPVATVTPAQLADSGSALVTGWGGVQEADGQSYRPVASKAVLRVGRAWEPGLLVRVRLGAEVATAPTDFARFTLAAGVASRADTVAKPRWFTWALPVGADLDQLMLTTDKPVRVYGVEIYHSKTP